MKMCTCMCDCGFLWKRIYAAKHIGHHMKKNRYNWNTVFQINIIYIKNNTKANEDVSECE